VIKHAYKGDTGKKIVVKFRTTRKRIEVVLEDTGKKTDPAELKGRDLEDVRPGGLGMHFIRKAFDVCELDPHRKKGNRLRLVLRLKEKDEDRDNGK